MMQEVCERLHKAVDGGATIKKAWEKVGRKGLGRSVVGEVREGVEREPRGCSRSQFRPLCPFIVRSQVMHRL